MLVPSHSLAESALGVGPAGTQAAMGPLPASLFSRFPRVVCAHCQTPTWWGSTLKASTLSLSPPVCAALGWPCCDNDGQQSAQWRVTTKHSARPPQCHTAPVLPGGGRPESSSQLPLPGPLGGSGVGLTRHLPVTLSLWPVPLGQLPSPSLQHGILCYCFLPGHGDSWCGAWGHRVCHPVFVARPCERQHASPSCRWQGRGRWWQALEAPCAPSQAW